jgi:hypothetical protein
MIKTTSKSPFFLMETGVLEDRDLSLAAKGLYAYIQSQGGMIDLGDMSFKDKANKKALEDLIDADLIHISDE